MVARFRNTARPMAAAISASHQSCISISPSPTGRQASRARERLIIMVQPVTTFCTSSCVGLMYCVSCSSLLISSLLAAVKLVP